MRLGLKSNNEKYKPEILISSMTSNPSDLTKKSFLEWLSAGNIKGRSPFFAVDCLDKVSKYALERKISFTDLWNIKKPTMFKSIYNKLLNEKLLRIRDKDTYKTFMVAGRLYLKFLKEKPITNIGSTNNGNIKSLIHKKNVSPVVDEHKEKLDKLPKHVPSLIIDPEDVIAWLVTQPNTNGTLYLENVVRQYMGVLRSAPSKIKISNPVIDDKNVFAYHTPNELIRYWNLLKDAPNYKQVNAITSGMFSAGMSCYLRYLEHLENNSSQNTDFFEETKDRKLTNDNYPITISKTNSIDKEITAAIDFVFVKKFSNGFRYSNKIELSRLQRLIKEQLGKELILSNDEIVKHVRLQGTEYKGKIYIISKDTKECIQRLIDDYFRQGATAIFYAEFYAKHESWFLESSIVSEEMLTDFLRTNIRNFYFTKTYFGNTNDSVYNVLQNEILRVWDNEILLTYEAISERLAYIPQFRIEQHLGQNNDFIWNTKGEFTHVSKIDIAECEKYEIANYIESEIRIHDYASISNVPLNEIVDRNYMLSISAIHNAIYLICLADKYSKYGKIITRKDKKINTLHIMKEYCKTLDRCTLDELLNYERNLTGECHRWIPMQAGYDVLVRIDENTFVAERYINFDTSAIDTAIEYFLHGGEYIPLQSVTTFAMLPHCGEAWNLFLLESYCRRFSDDFRFECLSVNSKNAGAIVRKKSQLSYTDIIVDAVAKSNIPLTTQPVLNFLVENGYISTRRYTKVAELTNQAKAKRNKQERG